MTAQDIPITAPLTGRPVPGETLPMEARSAAALPEGEGWQYEPKWDGFRCLAFRDGDTVDLRAKSGKPLGRYFPEMVETVRQLPGNRFVLDGELVIAQNGHLSFDALQMRLHPAESRIRKLAAATPATLILFDMLSAPDGNSFMQEPLSRRRVELERFFADLDHGPELRLSPRTGDLGQAKAWLDLAGEALDGVVAKQSDAPYLPGERAMVKVKRLRTADCVVGGFRYGQGSPLVGSLLLGLYDDASLLNHVGFTSSFADLDREALTRDLEALRGAGFTGRSPGGPSRWSTERSTEFVPLRPELVVEVRYDQVTGDRFRHGTKFLRWRPDKAPEQCRFDQLDQPASPSGWRIDWWRDMAENLDAVEIAGVRLSSPDKVLYPEQGITKRDLADYYVAVSTHMLPHVAGRPITLVRCPTGRQKKCFYQRHAGSGVPPQLGQVEIAGFEESGAYLTIHDTAGLVALVQMGVLEIHPWGAREDAPEKPDRVIFDLDPGEGLYFPDVVKAAREIHDVLSRELGLTVFLKTTGGKGLHLIVPIARSHKWADVKAFGRGVGDVLSARAPERYLTRISKAQRRGRIFIDYLRNDPTSTAVAPYSTRSRPDAPVSTPLHWEELVPELDPASLTIRNVPARLNGLSADPWAGIDTVEQVLPASMPA